MMPTRPIMRYHGGKWRLAPWIIQHMPPHRVYVEPFGGAASVLLRKPRTYAEVYNDMDGEIVNLFKVARDDSERLKHLLELTPFSRDEFAASYEPTSNPIEQARRTVVRSFLGFGSNAHAKATGFRANSNRSGTTLALPSTGKPRRATRSWRLIATPASPTTLPRLRPRSTPCALSNATAAPRFWIGHSPGFQRFRRQVRLRHGVTCSDSRRDRPSASR